MSTHLEINLENLKNNIQNIKHLLKSQTKMMAVVKSNAYGHGIIGVSKSAVQAGADWLGVINIDEAIVLRQAGIFKPILILGNVDNNGFRLAANKDISVPIISLELAREVSEINFDKPLKVHLKIETGLNRLGLKQEEIAEAVKILSSHHNIVIEGVYSHFASVEENDLVYAKKQIIVFREAIKILEKLGYKDLIKHIASTSATMVLPESHFDMVRCGIGIYGLWPSIKNKKQFDDDNFLRPVLSYKTEITQVKKINKGEKIGYGCSFTAKSDMAIAIVPVGYADGLDRKLSNNIGSVLISGTCCPIVGRVCMNMTIVDISKVSKGQSLYANQKDCPLGEVVIIGKQSDEEITVDEMADKIGTINYEVVARLPEHLERNFS